MYSVQKYKLSRVSSQVSTPFNFSLSILFFSFVGAGWCKTFVGTVAINTSKHCSANMLSLTLAKSQTVLNFSNYTLTQLTGVISALTLCFTKAMSLNLHWFFYRLLRNVAIDMFWGDPSHSKKTTKKMKPCN